jgi:two-component system KDP operon response regulator KdpE
MSEKILAIDDDAKLLSLVEKVLRPYNFSIYTAMSGEKGLEMFHQVTPDLVILDVMIPDMDGWEVCERIRQVSSVPIIFLTALDSVEDTVQGLQQGADDYLAKPFKVNELQARVLAMLRRARMPHKQPDVLRFRNNQLVINQAEKKVFAQDQEVSLSPIEYNLLLYMAKRAGRILPTQLIFDAIWGTAPDTGPDNVKWYIWQLRQKIEEDPSNPHFILTERGKGYRFSSY